ncbi:uncharacterized protein LOC113281591 isoform X1 [Papaver somniferum]|uniref:uncharacterized protein LOC113281591 isoform X1 n=1 Tax=Papaver somniferum TaxID=3469 RepID=UPI000E6FEC94|nr:uncharacterized protein LOC113281591 isoform X1 [Papaver somniferum]
MDDSWRYRPIQGNNICPSCSTPHYPFCSHNQPPPPLDRNGYGPPIHHHHHHHHHHQRPYFDPYHDSNSRVRPPPPSYGNLNDVSWNSSNHVRKCPEPVIGVNGFTSSYDYGNGGEFFESDRMNKRIKVDNNMNPGSIGPAPAVIGDYNLNANGVYTDDERRLGLGRQHGGNSSVHPGVLGGGEARGSDWVPRPPSNNGATNFHDTGFGSVDQQHMRSETNGFHPGFTSVDHCSDNHLKPPSAQSYEGSVFQTTQQCQDFAVVHEEKGFQHMNQREVYYQNKQHGDIIQQPNVSYGASYPGTQASQGEFRANSYQPLQSKDTEPTKGLQSNLTTWQMSPASYLPNQDLHHHGHTRDLRHSQLEGIQKPHNFPLADKFGAQNSWERAPQTFGVQPPLPPGPPPPLPVDPPGPPLLHMQATRSPNMMPSLYPIPVGSFDAPHSLLSSAYKTQSFPLRHPSPDKPKRIDASLLLRQPHRATRPDHIVIILRGLPGSGKSYLAKMLRDLEVENGGGAPRIHSMDDYFMNEVEKVDEREESKTAKGRRKTVTKKVMEYCYEPEMEEAYRASMLKAFRKTLEDGSFTFIIVDDRNLRVADFAQFWATAKRTGYEVYLLEAAYKDPMGCAARNVHGFTSDDIQKMATLWEEAPPLYLQLDTQSLIRGNGPNESGIQEVDMDMEEDVACDEGSAKLQDPGSLRTMEPLVKDDATDGLLNDGERWHDEGNDDSIGVKELGRSKWSLDEDEYTERPRGPKGKLNAPSGLLKPYSMKKKSVHWGDQGGRTGFSIGAAKKSSMKSLVIGPGAGYNLKSNPVSEEVKSGNESSWGTKSSVFQEHIRAERESFRAVFDRRRHRIQGLDAEDE